jgi:hypothetical protein
MTHYDIFYPELKPQVIPHSPPSIALSSIIKMKNKHQLQDLERKYDKFLQTNQHLLFLHNIIEDYLDIRDALIIQIQRLQREERRQSYHINTHLIDHSHNENQNKNENLNYNQHCEYTHEFQYLFPPSLRINQVQMIQGYIPCPNEPKEYKCGCLSIKYYSPCACKKQSNTVCKNPVCNEKRYPPIKSHAYCRTHSRLIIIQTDLEEELTKVKKELSYIRRNSNSLDYDDYQNTLSSHSPKRVSRFPWKNSNNN